MADEIDIKTLAAEIVAAYVSNNTIEVGQVPDFIRQTMKALSGEAPFPNVQAEPEVERRLTPGQIRKSITPDALISFEDGRPYKALKRHLSVRGMTPAEYRSKWGLPGDYPMTAASYSAARSNLAKQLGLGQKGRGRKPPPRRRKSS